MDEVVADLIGYSCFLHEVETGEKIDRNTLTDWEMNGRILRPYFHREGVYRKLDVIKDSQMVLRELSVNHRIFFVTAAPTPSSAMEKKMWVDEHFPWIGQKNVITTYNKELIRGDLLFDDSPEFLPKFPGIQVCMDAPHNRHIDFPYRVKDWISFLKLIEFFESNGTIKWCEPSQLREHMKRP